MSDDSPAYTVCDNPSVVRTEKSKVTVCAADAGCELVNVLPSLSIEWGRAKRAQALRAMRLQGVGPQDQTDVGGIPDRVSRTKRGAFMRSVADLSACQFVGNTNAIKAGV